MWLPLLILVSSVIVVRQITKASGDPLIKVGSPRVLVSGDMLEDPDDRYQGLGRRHHDGDRGVFQTQGLPSSIIHLLHHIRNGQEPPKHLIDQAIADAYSAGRWDVVDTLCKKWPNSCQTATAHGDQADNSGGQGDNVGTVIGKNSPFDGVSNEDWNRFVDRLATEKDDYRTDKHVGRFHHSKHRLSQLGIDAESLSPKQQYDALVADLSDSGQKSKDLIDQFMCTPITINGQDHMITMSGLFTLLKAAGPGRAKSWLVNEEDRIQYPKTTEMFLQTNGMF